MRYSILGGGGFIGTNLAQHLLADGHKVRVFGRPSAIAPLLPDVEYRAGEFSDAAALREAVRDQDVVFHLIGATNPVMAENDKIFDLRANVENTINLLECGRAGMFGRLVFLSSGGTVYGIQQLMPIHEDAVQWPISSYGVTKATIERYLHLYEHLHGVDYRIARLSNPFGEYQVARKGQGLVATLLRCVVMDETVRIVGDGSVVRDYIYIRDAVDALCRIAGHTGAERAFNVGTGIGYSVIDLINLVEQAAGVPVKREYLPPRRIDVPVNILDVGRATRELAWNDRTPMTLALRRSLDWMRSWAASGR